MLEKAKKVLGIKSDATQVPKNAEPAGNRIPSPQGIKAIEKSTQQADRAVSAQATKPAIGPAQPVAGPRTEARSERPTAQQVAKSPAISQVILKTESRPISSKGTEPKMKLKTSPVSDDIGNKKGDRRPKNTQVISMQMPKALIKVLDEIVEAGAYRSRSDLMLQAIRTFPVVDERLMSIKPKQIKPKK